MLNRTNTPADTSIQSDWATTWRNVPWQSLELAFPPCSKVLQPTGYPVGRGRLAEPQAVGFGLQRAPAAERHVC